MSFNTKTASYTLIFMMVLSVICAVILSSLASALKTEQDLAKDLDRSKEMMIASKIMNREGYFLLPKESEEGYQNAKYVGNGKLESDPSAQKATNEQILEVYRSRLIPFLVDAQGNPTTFEEKKIDMKTYLSEHKKLGYYRQPLKLIYKILPNGAESGPIGYVIPVNGYGLWDAIFGYIALFTDGNTVIGISWYDQKETPGLGANITEADWQANFPGKKIFAQSTGSAADFQRAEIGINVIRGKVSDVLSASPKALSAVDGMAGATLTGNGVTSAYKDTLSAYRGFLSKLATQKEAK